MQKADDPLEYDIKLVAFLDRNYAGNTHSVLTVIFPRESGLAGCFLNSPSPFIPGLRILLGQA